MRRCEAPVPGYGWHTDYRRRCPRLDGLHKPLQGLLQLIGAQTILPFALLSSNGSVAAASQPLLSSSSLPLQCHPVLQACACLRLHLLLLVLVLLSGVGRRSLAAFPSGSFS